ncbi:MAG: hypothetical protein M0Q02_08815 [Candidatus Muirbacterium halophilum]|nr:hypothetical protein [Candidatus Muirbacterium halophilum]
MNDKLQKNNQDILSEKINNVNDNSFNRKKTFVKRDLGIRVQKTIPDSIILNSNNLKQGMKLGCVIFKNNNTLMEAETILDAKKIEYLVNNTEFVYIVEEKEVETLEEENSVDVDSLLNSQDFVEINLLIKKNALKINDFEKIFNFIKDIPKNDEIDSIFNTVLQYYDLNIRENILESIKYYEPEKYYTELFRVIIDFEIEDINEHKNTLANINSFFIEKNTTFFKILASYYDVLEEDKKVFIFELLKKIDKEKLKKLLIIYSNDSELKDLAYSLLNIMKNDFVIIEKKPVLADNIEKPNNEINFKTILKEIEARKNRKDRILSEIAKININSIQKDASIKSKKTVHLKTGDVITEAYYHNENLVFPSDTILTEENIEFIKKYSREEIKVYNINDLYEFFCSITESVEDILEKLDLFIYLLENRDGKSELDTLSVIINFPDRELKISALKYMITNISPKRFAYIIAAMRQDIPELSEMLKSSFEQKKDLFSFKLFLKVASDENNALIDKRIRGFVKKSNELLDMVRIIIRTAPPKLKKMCFDILG